MCSGKVFVGIRGDYQLAFSLNVPEVLSDLPNVIRGLSVILPTGRCFLSLAGAVALIDHEICFAVLLYGLRRLKYDVRSRIRFRNDVEYVRAGSRVGLVAVHQEAQRCGVDSFTPVVRIEYHVLCPAFRKVIRRKVESAAANVDVCFAELDVFVRKQRGYLLDRRFRGRYFLRDGVDLIEHALY